MFPSQNNEIPSSAKTGLKTPYYTTPVLLWRKPRDFLSISWIVWFQIAVCIWILNQSEVRSDLVARSSCPCMLSVRSALSLNSVCFLTHACFCWSNYYINRSGFVFTRPNWVRFISYWATTLDKLFNKGGHLGWKSFEMFLSKTFFGSDVSLLYELNSKSTLFG